MKAKLLCLCYNICIMHPRKQLSNIENYQADRLDNGVPNQNNNATVEPNPNQVGDVLDDTQVPRVTLESIDGVALASNGSVPSQVEWIAKEYIAPEKSTVWYIGLFVISVAGILLDFFILKSWTFSMLIIAIAAVLIVMAVRPARDIKYKLSSEGLSIGDAIYRLDEYRAFGILHDGKENSIYLMPIKRFKPGLSVYFPVSEGERIVDFLSSKLPMQEVSMDFIDRIVRLFKL